LVFASFWLASGHIPAITVAKLAPRDYILRYLREGVVLAEGRFVLVD
jgi:hypothetical protein